MSAENIYEIMEVSKQASKIVEDSGADVEENNNNCLHCKTPIYDKRCGAIYCSVKCGYTFRNIKKRIQNKHQNDIIKIIKSNDEILRQLDAKNKSVVSFDELYILGFNFKYHTKLILEENKVVGTECFFLQN